MNVRMFTVKSKVFVLVLLGLVTTLAACQPKEETPTDTNSPAGTISPAETPAEITTPVETPATTTTPGETPATTTTPGETPAGAGTPSP
jgi:hypothetical protein